MTLLLQNLPPLPSSTPHLHHTRFHAIVCGVSSSNADKPRIKPKTTKIKLKEPDDYHATLKALNSKGRTPRKALGQHYMLNNQVNEQLVDAANVGDGDMVLEIGPGTGSLTNVLVESGATILAIEKDPYMATLIRERFASTQRVKVIPEDFTKCHLRSHLSSFIESDSNQYAKVVANIPFNISSDVVKQLLPMGDVFSEVVLLLQEEAALRMVDASLRTSEYRPINIFINFYSNPEYKFKVPRENFFPQPKVDAAVVVFRLKQEVDYPKVSSIKTFFSMVNSAFNGKRKMLRKSLQHITSSLEIEEALVNLGLPATVDIDEELLVNILSGSPLLETLVLEYCEWPHIPSESDDESESDMIEISAPTSLSLTQCRQLKKLKKFKLSSSISSTNQQFDSLCYNL